MRERPGPRLARLVYCGTFYGYFRSAMVLAGIHTIAGRGDLLSAQQDLRQATKDGHGKRPCKDVAEGAETFQCVADSSVVKLGISFECSNAGITVSNVKASEWAAKNGIRSRQLREGERLAAHQSAHFDR